MKFKLTYCDGEVVVREFETFNDGVWFCLNEGDHLIDWDWEDKQNQVNLPHREPTK